MLRTRFRPLQHGLKSPLFIGVVPNTPLLRSINSQAANVRQQLIRKTNRTAPKRNKTIPLDDVFYISDKTNLGFGKKIGRKGKAQSKPQANRTGQKISSTKLLGATSILKDTRGLNSAHDPEIFTNQSIRKCMSVPTASEYGLSQEPADHPGQLLVASDLEIKRTAKALRRVSNAGGRLVNLKCTNKIHLSEEDGTLEVVGHGESKKDAILAADLHTICELHRRGLFKEILPHGRFNKFVSVSGKRLAKEADAKMDIINYAALHDCFPIFTSRQSKVLRKKAFTSTVTIPSLGVTAHGRSHIYKHAVLHACTWAKDFAELRQKESGEGSLLVNDFTRLTSESAEKFVRFYAQEKRLSVQLSSQVVSHSNCDEWTTSVELQGWQEGSITPTFNEITDHNGTIKKSKFPISGIPMDSKARSETTAYLAAALELKLDDQPMWKTFVREIRRGNGTILKPVPPIDADIGPDVPQTARDAAREVQILQMDQPSPSALKDSYELSNSKRATTREFSPDLLEAKSDFLRRKQMSYEIDPSTEKIRHQRSQLPMVQHGKEVMQLVNGNQVCVVVGATGSGKTTQLPQLILEEAIRAGKGASCNVICTQPRRIAATSVAERVAAERNESLRQSVGYSVRFDSKFPQFGGSIHYCTTGILLRQIQDDQDAALDGISHIIIDEVHERDVQIDFLLLTIKQLIAERMAAGKAPLKLILMSATIDKTLFCKYFGEGFQTGECPYIEVPGRTFPVTQHFLEDIHSELQKNYEKKQLPGLHTTESKKYLERELDATKIVKAVAPVSAELEDKNDIDQSLIDWKSKTIIDESGQLSAAMDSQEYVTPTSIMALTIAHLLQTTDEGSILAFLPGLQEIMALERELKTTKPLGLDIESDSNFKLYILHSAVPNMQREVFEKLEAGKRKIILATNIAETSITIPDVVYVVDSSKQRETQYDKVTSTSGLVSAWTSKSNARQRTGRAGRVQHGHYYTMASRARYESFEVSTKAEILRTDLQSLCLQVKVMGIPDIWDFLSKAIEPPTPKSVDVAVDELQALGALDEEENLTPLGRLLSTLPLSPSLGKMIILAAVFKCLDPIVILAAASTGKDPFLSPLAARNEAEKVRSKWAQGTGSDHVALINAFQEWRHLRVCGRRDGQSDKDFAFNNFLHYNTLVTIHQTAEQILDVLEQSGIIERTPFVARKDRLRYGSATENTNSNSWPLQVALATVGFYPNIAIRTKNNAPRFLRTVHENDATIHPSSLAAPKTVDGRRYGPIRSQDASPAGTLFTFAQKTQADGNAINLRFVSRTFPMAIILFGGKISIKANILMVDDWIPFYARRAESFAAQTMNRLLQSHLENTFSQLGTKTQRHLLAQPSKSLGLSQDQSQDFLIRSIVTILEQCAPNLNFPAREERTQRRPELNNYSWRSHKDATASYTSSASRYPNLDSMEGTSRRPNLDSMDGVFSGKGVLSKGSKKSNLKLEHIFRKWMA
ncbi:hypothetical protein BP6252_02053 [Coleophoma cylindrospora]|uniref:RNA helicase n=1 Tax=Coleophoma cylindrospora TaxID=1849047 RepID=A0A3D8SDS4_9HELO|nr:hypothetical protein BP6252_02053 [Coleophoma cylindrospora]